jgi:UDP-N-acetylmuramoylalanine--D-glutamate ligase
MGEPDEFASKQVTVMGLGRFGGGVGVTRFLVDRGADVLVTDKDDADKLAKSVEKIQDLVDSGRVTLRLGEHNVSDFTTCDLVVVNPAVPPGNRFLRAAEAAGIEVTTQMRLLVQRLPNRLRTIGVTGSAGKSTVTAMIGHVLGKVFSAAPEGAVSPKVWVGGNIGGSLLPHLDEIGEDDWVVLELSSFMLERLKKDTHFPGWSPHIAVITNISPNHLDWHGSMEDYVAAKQQIFLDQHESDFCCVGFTPPQNMEFAVGLKIHKKHSLCVDPEQNFETRTKLPGKHNQVNAWLALATLQQVQLSDSEIVGSVDYQVLRSAITDFPGLPHRLQFVAEHNGVRYFNDSKCTTPEAAMLAIEAFIEGDDKPGIHLILGGKDKGSDMTPLAGLAAIKCKAVYTIGALGETIAGLIENEASRAVPDRPKSCGGVSWPAATAEVVRCGELDKAVAEIMRRVQPGDVVLLSPACASWDQFENYEQRGERFIELVNQTR